jgi:hypothetical protein
MSRSQGFARMHRAHAHLDEKDEAEGEAQEGVGAAKPTAVRLRVVGGRDVFDEVDASRLHRREEALEGQDLVAADMRPVVNDQVETAAFEVDSLHLLNDAPRYTAISISVSRSLRRGSRYGSYFR